VYHAAQARQSNPKSRIVCPFSTWTGERKAGFINFQILMAKPMSILKSIVLIIMLGLTVVSATGCGGEPLGNGTPKRPAYTN
jgi:hypothetical protein